MNRPGFPIPLALAAAMVVCWCTGCAAPPIKPVLTDPDPSVKIPAMRQAVQRHDQSAIPILIKNLENDDPAVRFYAIDALRKLTGQDFGFLYYSDDDVRRPAVERWKSWLAAKTPAPAASSTQP
jgi:hypothetical protein